MYACIYKPVLVKNKASSGDDDKKMYKKYSMGVLTIVVIVNCFYWLIEMSG